MRKRTVGLISAVGLVVAPLVALAGPAERSLGPRILKHYDTNQDRTITAAEVAAVNRSELETHDADQSGSLSLAEFERLWLARIRERMVDRFQRLDADGDGNVTAEEFAAPSDRLMTWVDRNGDQQVSVDELRQMRGKRGGRGEGRRGERRNKN